MIAAVALVSIVTFLAVLWRSGIVSLAGEAMATTQGAMAVMRDPALNERAREQAVQRASLRLFGHFFALAWRAIVCLGVSLVPVGVAGLAGLAPPPEVLAYLARWQTGAVATVLALAVYVAGKRLWPTS